MNHKKSIYVQRHDGEGFTIPNKTIYKLTCCDCGLVHKLVIFAEGRKGKPLGVAASRDNRSTGQRRRQKKLRIVSG